MITAVGAWAFVNSTACSERDPFQFASIMDAHAKVHVVQTARPQDDHLKEEVAVYTPSRPAGAAPPCLGSCA